jgi:predicted metal-dependent phosphoesterase TrpH
LSPTFRADLHCHSTCSDGSCTPVELVQLAKKNSLQGLAITDHDTVAAYRQALPEAQKLEMRLIPGVEFSSHHQGQNVHILGYRFDPDHPAIQKLCHWHETRRKERCRAILERLSTLGHSLRFEDVMAQTQSNLIGRPHIALAMVKKGIVGSVKEAFQTYLGDGKSAYVPGDSVTVEETLQTLHAAGGVAIIAHPHLIQNKSLVDALLARPFDGIEVYYGRFNADQNRPWAQIAAKRNWLITGGSDFHGSIKPELPLGASWVDKEHFDKLTLLCE